MSSGHPDHVALAPGKAIEVSEGIFAYIQPDGSWFVNNTAFLLGSQGVVSIDACSTEQRTRDYLDAIAAISPKPVRTLINTHHHGDHTFGNYLFPTAAVIGHDNVRAEVLAHGMPFSAPIWTETDWGGVRLEPPFITFSDEITVHSDDLACQVTYAGQPAHTTNDSYVWIPERKVLIAGDLLFNGGTPFLMAGSIDGTISVLEERIKPLVAETIIPGHGAVCGPEVVDEVLGYLKYVRSIAAEAHAGGLTPLLAAREFGAGPYAELLDSERLVGNLHRAYADLDGTPPGAPIDYPAVLAEMVAYNGGKPLTCLA
ncbi:MAG: Zn-dependent hydrolase, glyoxylase [Amycolatopsis sp.]|uniref:MBL fold metallo-hydrolase n=1 Tax=Amycolatopsis sp. TaxID=37632 RepID=UPI00262764D5|nr:MBL fold metallo-hydrolase [Amycolatopsis sp.]MCU1680598.1 Zn-dependent hydrolase, glyoxylase [Amycolatopsis sp.]